MFLRNTSPFVSPPCPSSPVSSTRDGTRRTSSGEEPPIAADRAFPPLPALPTIPPPPHTRNSPPRNFPAVVPGPPVGCGAAAASAGGAGATGGLKPAKRCNSVASLSEPQSPVTTNDDDSTRQVGGGAREVDGMGRGWF